MCVEVCGSHLWRLLFRFIWGGCGCFVVGGFVVSVLFVLGWLGFCLAAGFVADCVRIFFERSEGFDGDDDGLGG